MSSAVDIAKAAKSAFEASQLVPADERVEALHVIRQELESRKAEILAANSEDLQVCPQRCPSYHQAVHSCLHTDKRLPKQRWMRVACQNRCSNG